VNPFITLPSLLEICDDDVVDGFAEFDLRSRDAEIIGNQTNVVVSYHLSQNDADLGINPLPDNYTNNINPQIVFLRVENTITNCFVTNNSTLELMVQGETQANTPMPFEICDEVGTNDGIAQFDLNTLNSEILGTQDPNEFRVSYYFSENDAEMDINEITGLYTNVTNPQILYARVTNIPIGCFNITPATLLVNLKPEFDLGDREVLCLDGDDNIISTPTLDTGLSSVDFTFEWQLNGTLLPNENGSTLTVDTDGVYTATVTNINTSCSDSRTIEVIRSTPPLVFNAEVVTRAFTQNNRIEVSVIGGGNYEYRIDDGPFQEEAFFESVSPGTHIITIRDINGCGSVTVEVFVIDYPRFFTPNGDGFNDVWNIISTSTLREVNISIFDRFGKLLTQISPDGQGWDGIFNGEQLPSSDYWFLINFIEDNEPRQFRGHFTLKR